MANSSVTKIYTIKETGYNELHKKFLQISKDLLAVKSAAQQMQAALATSGNVQGVQAYRTELQRIRLEEAELSKQSKQLAADMKVQQLQRTEQIKQLRDATALQNAQSQAAALAARQQQQNNTVTAGSYAALVQQAKEFYALLKNTPKGGTLDFRGKTFSYQEAIDEYSRLSTAEQSFRRQFAADKTLVGEYTTGIVQAFKQMGLGDLVSAQVSKAVEKLRFLAAESTALKSAINNIRQGAVVNPADIANFEQLDRIIRETGTDGQAAMQRIEAALITNVREAGALRTQIHTVNNELRGTGDIGDRITTGLREGFRNLRGQVAQFALSFYGVQAAMMAIVGTFSDLKKLTDQYADLQRVLHITGDEFDNIREQIKSIDTRTNLNDLFDTAIIAARAGVAKENIAGVTKAIDQLKQVAGNELGDVDAATTSIVKLINIFDGPGQVTEENVLKFGNALVELANAGVASGGFLVDFAQRLAGIQGITGITIKSVLGLAAAFEEQGQSAEVSATATTQILGKVGADVEKYAAIAKKPVEEFRQLLRTNPAEALLELAEGLKGDAKAFDEIAPKFKDLEAKGVRVQSVFGVMADKADFFRQKIAIAGAALQDTNAIITGAAAKQEDFAGTIDKIGKSFQTAFSNEGFLKVLEGLASAVLDVVKVITAIPFAVIITGLTLATAAWAYYRGNVISATIAQSANNEATLLGMVRRAAERLGLISTTAATVAQTQATQAATVATEELNVATKASPLGIILGLIALFIPVITAFASKLHTATDEMNKQNTSLRSFAAIEGDLQAKMQEQTFKTKNTVAELVNIIKTEVDNLGLRKSAYEALIKISPDFVGTLDDQFRATDRLNTAYEAFIVNLDKVARAQAIKNTKQKIEDDRAAAQAEAFNAKVAADEEARNNKAIERQNKLIKARNESSSGNLAIGGGNANGLDEGNQIKSLIPLQTEKAEAFKKALAKAKDADAQAKAFDDFMKGANEEDKKALIEGLGGTGAGSNLSDQGKQTLEILQQRLKEINAQIAAMDGIANKDKAQLVKLQQLRQTRTEILKEIKELGGATGPAKAARLSANEIDDLNGIDAQRKREIADLELYYAEIKRHRELDVDEQVQYLKQLQEINARYDSYKIDSIKGNNAKELAERATLNLQIIENDISTTEKIKAIYKKAFEEKSALLKKQLESSTAKISLDVEVVENNPDATNETKAKAQQQANLLLLGVQRDYFQQVLTLAQIYGQKTNVIEEEMQKTFAETQRKGLDDARKIIEAKLQDIDVAYERAINSIQDKYDNLRIAIIRSAKTPEQKDLALDQINRIESIEQATKKLQLAQKAYNDVVLQPVNRSGSNQVSNDVAEKLHHNVEQAAQELQNAITGIKPKVETLQHLLQNKLSKLFNFDINTDKGKAQYQLMADTISAAFTTAGNAMNAYFDAENNRIQASLKLQEKRLDIETEQRIARAQSQAEETSINKQAQEQREALERAAFEKQKKQQIAQAEINLATQLSNLAVIAFAPNPLNIATLGTAGAIMYAIQAALAFANFGINVGKIKSATYEYGGEVKRGKNNGGGINKGKTHAQGGNKFMFDGEVYEDEVNEIRVIRTKDAEPNKRYSIAGTQAQIASALNVLGGGHSFQPGAMLKRFEWGGGITLQKFASAPSFSASQRAAGGGVSSDDMHMMFAGMMNMTAAINNRIDRLEVVQDIDTVTKAQSIKAKQKQNSTL